MDTDISLILYISGAFAQADVWDTCAYEGYCLGLEIACSLVHMRRGEIRIESEKGNGTASIILFPFREPAIGSRHQHKYTFLF